MDQSKPQERLNLKTEKLFVNPDNITYGHESYEGFDVRIVYITGEPKGEFHIKPGEGVDIMKLFEALKNVAGNDCEVNLVDRSGVLTIEFPIYAVVKNPMLMDAMESIWKAVEQTIQK